MDILILELNIIRGVDNRVPDLLSRLFTNGNYKSEFLEVNCDLKYEHVNVTNDIFEFCQNW